MSAILTAFLTCKWVKRIINSTAIQQLDQQLKLDMTVLMISNISSFYTGTYWWWGILCLFLLILIGCWSRAGLCVCLGWSTSGCLNCLTEVFCWITSELLEADIIAEMFNVTISYNIILTLAHLQYQMNI